MDDGPDEAFPFTEEPADAHPANTGTTLAKSHTASRRIGEKRSATPPGSPRETSREWAAAQRVFNAMVMFQRRLVSGTFLAIRGSKSCH